MSFAPHEDLAGAERSAEVVRDSLVAALTDLPESLRGSLTWDQDAEMTEHRSFAVATDMNVYFCDPGSPWQRGSNENTNGLLRQRFPRERTSRSTTRPAAGRRRRAQRTTTKVPRLGFTDGASGCIPDA